ncbi:type VII secretion-associated serine protease mycosin [Streptomyces sp. NPDC047315]|uniref:type VII secretion-associated serine protease mycosin n=1 Tax=Streptomyces sp. NPDC047315 TaxID=3155142 RepID=UPI0033C2FB72
MTHTHNTHNAALAPGRGRRVAVVTAATALAVIGLPIAPAAADTTQCEPTQTYKGVPWSLQRVMLDELWKQSTGEGVRVAVIDTGVDITHPQLKGAVDAKSGTNLLPKKNKKGEELNIGKANGTDDAIGHGTKVAGIIAARKMEGSGFVGLAPDAKIIPIKQNDADGNGSASTLADAVDHAVAKDAHVINISQDTANAAKPDAKLQEAVNRALAADVVVVASAGNDGGGGNVKKTYPASFEGVLAVGASDRNNERAPFSQSGGFVGVAAPGVDMVSTVPGGGHCADNGTSFSAPYVAGVAALIKAKHPKWTAPQIVAQMQQTAERSTPGQDRLVGWGVVDPLRALTEDDEPIDKPTEGGGLTQAEGPTPAKYDFGETAAERNARLATYVVIGGGVLVAAVAGGAVAVRDARRRASRVAGG